MSDWRHSWLHFVESLEKRISEVDSDKEISRPFNGSPVEWEGTISDIDLDEIAPSIGLELPPKVIQLSEGRSDTIGSIHLPIASDSRAKWRALQVGDKVTFQASLSENGPFPPIQVKHLKSGRSLVLIGLRDGVPVSKAR
jgi:hypothetical protein